MSAYTLRTLDASEYPEPGTLSSLIFAVPFPENTPGQFFERYAALRTEHGMDEESHYQEASALLVLEAYNDIHPEREAWTGRAASVFQELMEANKNTLRHVELILPTGGIATPLNLFSSVKQIANLESLCVQWPFQGYFPMTILLMREWSHILEDGIIPTFAQFRVDLMDVLATHAASLKRLRISLPESTLQKPFSAPSINIPSLPSLPALELLDLTHWDPRIVDITALLQPDGPVPNLLHLIIDHGTELPLTDFGDDDDDDDDDEEVPPDYDPTNPPPQTERHSWPALGAHLAAHKHPLRSLSAALCSMRYSFAPVGCRLKQVYLRDLLCKGTGGNDSALDGLVLCTAWPTGYEAQELEGSEATEDKKDLYTHAPGCGHLAYLVDQRPTTGLWPANTAEASATLTLAGRPWY
ncbi:hypothetical protein B0H19DRAFT_1080209 [Mycena capillaripes]|nr:hypothetical protein B0H19DRAFT_1080209 [Mycena capillaripes]